MLLIFTKTVYKSRTWLRLVPSVRVNTMHTATKIQIFYMKHVKSLNAILYYLLVARSTYTRTSTQEMPRSSLLARNTYQQQQYLLIFKQYVCIYHKNRTCLLYTVQYISTTKDLFRRLHLNLLTLHKNICYLHYVYYLFIFFKNRCIKLHRQSQNCKTINITILK